MSERMWSAIARQEHMRARILGLTRLELELVNREEMVYLAFLQNGTSMTIWRILLIIMELCNQKKIGTKYSLIL